MLAIIIEGLFQPRDGDGGGLRTIANRVRDELGATVAYLQWDDDVTGTIKALHTGHPDEPIVVLGYSYGGGKAIRSAWELNALGIQVDELILLDDVGRWASGQFQNFWQVLLPFIFAQDSARITVPVNVLSCKLFYQRLDSPWGVLVQERINGSVVNTDVSHYGSGHVELPGNPNIQQLIIDLFSGHSYGVTTK